MAAAGSVQYLNNLTHNLNRNFVRADDARNGSEETATFTVSKLAITREQSSSLQIHKSTNPREHG